MRVFLRSAVTRGAVGLYGLGVGFIAGKALGLPLGHAEPNNIYTFLKDQGSLIAGALAVGAAWMTVRATVQSANREVAAAQKQTDAALAQTRTGQILDQRRVAREGHAFASVLLASMDILLSEIDEAKSLIVQGSPAKYSMNAYAARQAITRTGFEDIRFARAWG